MKTRLIPCLLAALLFLVGCTTPSHDASRGGKMYPEHESTFATFGTSRVK